VLSGKGITKTFGANEVLHGADIDVEPGRVSVLMGPSGCGKTTLIRALALLDLPTSGEVTFDGRVYRFPLQRGQSIVCPWPEITVVFQQHFLWPHLTLRENILLPLSERPESLRSVDELIDLFNMEAFIDRYPNQASLGERQRTALARAFALQPKYILLDEITSALDVEQTGAVVRHLLTLRGRGIGVMVVTHLIEFARQLVARNEGDRAYFLDAGRVMGAGGADFFENPGNPRVARFLASMDYWTGEVGK
jgi:ABC-type polar amino acid transport system ATPase subunit